MEQEIKNIEETISTFKNNSSKLEGRLDHLKEVKNKLEEKEKECKKSLEYHLKSVEVLNLVQKVTRDKVKEQFENLVTYALQYILDDDNYRFVLEFGNRGNLSDLNFNIVTPDCQKPVDLFTCQAGGELDICALALRVVLLELDKKQEKSFILLDESLKWVHGEDYSQKAEEFIMMLNRKLNYQIIYITQSKLFTENADNPIEIK